MAAVLVYESDPAVLRLIELQLRRLGHEAVADAHDRWAGTRCGVAGVEPAAPGGLELARELRKHDPGLPLVFISTCGPRDETAALVPVAHLTKPFRLAQLAAALTRALGD